MGINCSRFRPFSIAKRLVLKSRGRRPYKAYIGLFRNLVLNLDLHERAQIYIGLYERETHEAIKTISSVCKWMIDVGAGQGELCLYFLKNSHAEKIIALEPQSSEIDILRSNLALNGEQASERVLILSKCVGTANHPNYVPLDALELEKEGRGFIKIDVEGHEMDVLESGERLLSIATVDLIIETHSRVLEEQCMKWLATKGYRCRIIRNAWWRAIIPEHRPLPHNRWIAATNAFT